LSLPLAQIEFVPAKLAHVCRLANRLRDIDRFELEAAGTDPKHGLRVAVLGSTISITAMVNGTPHAMFGVAPRAAWVGVPWFLGSDLVYREGRLLLEFGRIMVARFHSEFPTLENVVYSGNHRAIRLLKRWGFDVGEGLEMIGGEPFRRFRSIR
jgi:hypothetical protein